MAIIENHLAGSFCWFELAAKNQTSANNFYHALFGWNAVDFPMGPDEVYSMLMLDGKPAAASYTMGKSMQAQGVPSHWNIYMCVADADAAAKRTAELGGAVIASPFDVQDFGRMAVFSDPSGAMFSVWQPMSHKGVGVSAVDGAVCWADLHTPDRAKAQAFYSGLFSWEISTSPNDDSGYLHIKNGADFIGGIPPHFNPQAPPHWLIYFQVADCDATAGKAKDLGATFIVPALDIPNVGRMAVMQDPQGAVSALFQPPR